MGGESRGTSAKFVIEITQPGPPAVMAIAGEVDLATAPRLKEVLVQVIDQAKTVILDLSGATYMDSTGLGVLIGSLKHAREVGGDVKLAGLVPKVRRVFSITGVDKVFEIYSTVEQAMTGDQAEGGIAS
jgi:anti-sigma B factor antagonist